MIIFLQAKKLYCKGVFRNLVKEGVGDNPVFPSSPSPRPPLTICSISVHDCERTFHNAITGTI